MYKRQLPLNGTAIGQVKFQRGDIAAVQLLDQVQGTGQAQLGRVAVHTLFIAGRGITVLADVYKRQGIYLPMNFFEMTFFSF